MSNDENTREKNIEEQADALAKELASALAETVETESTDIEEMDAERPVEENVFSEEPPVNEKEADDDSDNDAPIGETSEEVVEDNVDKAPEKKSKTKSKKVLWIVIAAIVAFLAIAGGAYYAVSNHYSDRFFRGTSVNGVDCSENTIKEVKEEEE